MSVEITPSYEPESGTWTYLLADPVQCVAVIIDPVWVFDPVSGRVSTQQIDVLLNIAQQRNYRIEWVLETHAHADHLSSAGYIRDQTGARIAIGRGICAVQKTFTRVFNLKDIATDGSQFDRLLDDGDMIPLGALAIRVMQTPGHTGDSLTYLVEDAAFIGDTLFAPPYGTARCDFPGGNASDLFDSIQRIHGLPDTTRLFLCHDYAKDGTPPVNMVPISESRQNNIHIKTGTDREAYIAMRTQRDARLSLPRLLLPALQVNIRAGSAPAGDDNDVPYLRLPFNRTIAQILAGESH
ncbi:MAG: MBL fold metallo-hydrolase [Xanthomonadales bacterium]|nr:MBL fold metallo-hydrolase [Xanthomonadales bacterium]